MRKETLLRLKATFPALFIFFSTHLLHAQPDVSYQPLIGASAGLAAPMEVVSAPGDPPTRLFIVEKSGTIRIWNGNSLISTPFLDISSIVADDGERGLLSMAFHPNYETNGFFYVYYNANNGNITVARYSVSANPDIANTTATGLVSISKPFSNHNGGHLQFRVESGIPYLYFATGDGGSGNDPNNFAQSQNSLLGKMIRINVDVTPFVSEIWAWGLRNPFRWSFDRNTGDMWIGDVGQDSREEINFRAAGSFGANYGWSCVEGTQNNGATGASICDTVRSVDILPVLDYDNPTEGASVVGGYVYRGTMYPDMQGYYFATDYYSGRLWMIRPGNPSGWEINVEPGYATSISSISEGSDGTLYAVSLSTGAIYTLGTPIVTPLKLISFSGSAYTGYNELKWIAESEQGVDKYIVEYSTDARIFSTAGDLRAYNNGSRNNYSFRHMLNSVSRLYYRLKMMDSDGRFAYSPVISIGGDGSSGIRIYPTQINNGQLNVIAGQPVEKLLVSSADGRQIISRDMNGAEGFFTVPLPSLQKGIYLVRITGKNYMENIKVFIE